MNSLALQMVLRWTQSKWWLRLPKTVGPTQQQLQLCSMGGLDKILTAPGSIKTRMEDQFMSHKIHTIDKYSSIKNHCLRGVEEGHSHHRVEEGLSEECHRLCQDLMGHSLNGQASRDLD